MLAASISGSSSAMGPGFAMPFDTSTFTSPASWARRLQSRTYSKPTSGSLYVKASPTLPRAVARNAACTSSSGVTSRHGTSFAPAQAIEAFWQNPQSRLHPYDPTESTFDPRMKRASGFFSTGSSASDVTRP